MNTELQTFGLFLRKKRKARQITLREMAAALGISPPYLSDIEKDQRNPPGLAKLEAISNLLLLSAEDRSLMMDLAGKARNSVAPDLLVYISGRDYVTTALRTARDLDIGDEEWIRFMDELRKRNS